MASNSQGIQKLLQAEKAASEKVADARKKKAKRLKQAKLEAQAEIDAYRKQREDQFRNKEAQLLGSKDEMALTIDRDTDKAIMELSRRVKGTNHKALEVLLTAVFDIKPVVHINMGHEVAQ